MSLPLESISAALKGEPVRPQVKTRVSASPNVWGLVETGHKAEPAHDVAFTFIYGGNAPTAACSDAVVVVLKLDRAGIESLEPGDFDSAQAGVVAPDGRFESTGRARATAVRLTRFHMLPGETAKLGSFQTSPNGASEIRGNWSVKIAGGSRVFSGEIARKVLEKAGDRK